MNSYKNNYTLKDRICKEEIFIFIDFFSSPVGSFLLRPIRVFNSPIYKKVVKSKGLHNFYYAFNRVV